MGWRTPLVFWGVAAGAAVSLFLSDVPLFKKDVLIKIPVVSNYFIDKTPDSDKPF
ncbi:ubiquinol-cytochrome c reductase subunit 10 [Kwoniella heveanensis BCC8398]|uniref:Ubiquinol-cytochrome c reductase subunit 10 n=1 Tax=Kwoniella heveanensis BCC8398 TaxID=1296120 RepID=A0A1B9H423_9TREE|nr:ubiquinol-cytochrome c reductase subunit 10 [Kwoniella heveanensis BCC8398]